MTNSSFRNSKYLFFFKKVFLLFLIVAAFDYLIGYYLQYYYFKQSSGAQYRTTEAMEKTKAQVLIFGSSRANHHYYPNLFEEKLHKTFYNAGRDASSIFYDYAVFKSAMKRYHPQMVILDFQREEFLKLDASYDKLSILLPYYHAHPEIRPIVDLKGPYESLKLLSEIYPYNSSVLTIAAGNSEFNKTRKDDMEGYVPLYKKWPEPLKDNIPKKGNALDNNKVNAFISFIDDCKKANVKIVVVCSPYYVSYKKTDPSLEKGKQIARSKSIQFYDFSNSPFFLKHPDLFDDTFHLNNKGAKIFTNYLLGDLEKSNRVD